jgi:hypothetical protein
MEGSSAPVQLGQQQLEKELLWLASWFRTKLSFPVDDQYKMDLELTALWYLTARLI